MEQTFSTSAQNESNNASDGPSKSEKKHFHGILIVLSLLALTLAIAAIVQLNFSARDFSSSKEKTNATLSQLTKEVKQHEIALSSLKKDQETTEENMRQQAKTIETQASGLQKLITSRSSSSERWTLQEIKHSLETANITLHFERNIPATLTLLESAQQQLQTLGDPKLLDLQKLVASNITTVESIKMPALNKISLQLYALQKQISELLQKVEVVSLDGESTSNTNSNDKKQTDSKAWQRALNQTWKSFNRLIVIRKHDKPVTPLLPPSERNYLDQHLMLNLQEALWASINHQQTMWMQALKQIESWVTTYFTADDANTQSLLATIRKLKRIDVDPTLPAISALIKVNQILHKNNHYTLKQSGS